jgi:hypothetical protein
LNAGTWRATLACGPRPACMHEEVSPSSRRRTPAETRQLPAATALTSSRRKRRGRVRWMRRRLLFRTEVVTTKTALVGAAVDGDGGKRCSAGRRLRATLGRKRGRVSSRRGRRVQRVRGGRETAASASATFRNATGARRAGRQGGAELLSAHGGEKGRFWGGK